MHEDRCRLFYALKSLTQPFGPPSFWCSVSLLRAPRQSFRRSMTSDFDPRATMGPEFLPSSTLSGETAKRDPPSTDTGPHEPAQQAAGASTCPAPQLSEALDVAPEAHECEFPR